MKSSPDSTSPSESIRVGCRYPRCTSCRDRTLVGRRPLGLVFDAEPPHEIIATAQMSYGELRRAETFAVAVARIYGATL